MPPCRIEEYWFVLGDRHRNRNMLYSILCYNSEALVGAWTKEKDAEVMAGHEAILQAAIAAVHTQAERFEDTDWSEIDRLYAVVAFRMRLGLGKSDLPCCSIEARNCRTNPAGVGCRGLK